jgi:hypothetical protein
VHGWVYYVVEELTLLGPAHAALPLAQLVARAHEYLAQALLLPGRKHKDAREVVVVPAHLLLAEEADDLVLRRRHIIKVRMRYARGGIVRDEQVVQERRHVVEDGFCVEEQLGE